MSNIPPIPLDESVKASLLAVLHVQFSLRRCPSSVIVSDDVRMLQFFDNFIFVAGSFFFVF